MKHAAYIYNIGFFLKPFLKIISTVRFNTPKHNIEIGPTDYLLLRCRPGRRFSTSPGFVTLQFVCKTKIVIPYGRSVPVSLRFVITPVKRGNFQQTKGLIVIVT